MENRCVCCGEIIPEGRQVCPECEKGHGPEPKQERKERKKKRGRRNHDQTGGPDFRV